ncbi:hypothetical protein O181_085566 [Austropuccinia psidii MF-1]|uniref:Uncharacterized protein n=1 Tax=Austropuccinia psidii MF-1 TaxID=1389203 RepID=A0A9Q3FT58_9BASI|nr:hypothetical protein [Austropuccinia psidii MF-1]
MFNPPFVSPTNGENNMFKNFIIMTHIPRKRVPPMVCPPAKPPPTTNPPPTPIPATSPLSERDFVERKENLSKKRLYGRTPTDGLIIPSDVAKAFPFQTCSQSHTFRKLIDGRIVILYLRRPKDMRQFEVGEIPINNTPMQAPPIITITPPTPIPTVSPVPHEPLCENKEKRKRRGIDSLIVPRGFSKANPVQNIGRSHTFQRLANGRIARTMQSAKDIKRIVMKKFSVKIDPR